MIVTWIPATRWKPIWNSCCPPSTIEADILPSSCILCQSARVQFSALLPILAFCQYKYISWEAEGDCSSSWIPAAYMGDLSWVPDPQPWFYPHLSQYWHLGISTNRGQITVSLSSSLFPSLFFSLQLPFAFSSLYLSFHPSQTNTEEELLKFYFYFFKNMERFMNLHVILEQGPC